jgi:hypothetical protein
MSVFSHNRCKAVSPEPFIATARVARLAPGRKKGGCCTPPFPSVITDLFRAWLPCETAVRSDERSGGEYSVNCFPGGFGAVLVFEVVLM